jgi:hypothetical protein
MELFFLTGFLYPRNTFIQANKENFRKLMKDSIAVISILPGISSEA